LDLLPVGERRVEVVARPVRNSPVLGDRCPVGARAGGVVNLGRPYGDFALSRAGARLFYGNINGVFVRNMADGSVSQL
jgi:hypothetical protein